MFRPFFAATLHRRHSSIRQISRGKLDPIRQQARKGNPTIILNAKREFLAILEMAKLLSFRVVALQVHQLHQELRPSVDVLRLDQAIDKSHQDQMANLASLR